MKSACIAGLAAGLWAISGSMVGAQQIHVQVNGEPIQFHGEQPHQVNGRVLVPLRGVLENMGANVDWQPSSQTVIATRGSHEIDLPIGSRTATVDGNPVRLDVPAMTLGGYTMVPLRFVSQALGADVNWDGQAGLVTIATRDGDHASYRAARVPTPRGFAAHRARRLDMAIPAGAVIPVTLDDDLSSNGSAQGDRFTASVVPGPDSEGLPDGSKVEGVVREAIPSQNGRPGVLDLDVRHVVLPNGDTYALNANMTTLDQKYVTRNGSGQLVAKGGNNSNERLKWIGIGAGAGFVVSSVAKGNKLLDTLLGAGAGYLYNETRAKGASNVKLSSGAKLGVKMNQRLAFASGNGYQYRQDSGAPPQPDNNPGP